MRILACVGLFAIILWTIMAIIAISQWVTGVNSRLERYVEILDRHNDILTKLEEKGCGK